MMTTTTTVTVSGMQCEHCKRAVFTSLAAVPGVRSADVELGRVTVEHDGSVTEAQLKDAIDVAGYTVTGTAHTQRTLPLMPTHEMPDAPPGTQG